MEAYCRELVGKLDVTTRTLEEHMQQADEAALRKELNFTSEVGRWIITFFPLYCTTCGVGNQS